jgi:hypothetical protein
MTTHEDIQRMIAEIDAGLAECRSIRAQIDREEQSFWQYLLALVGII